MNLNPLDVPISASGPLANATMLRNFLAWNFGDRRLLSDRFPLLAKPESTSWPSGFAVLGFDHADLLQLRIDFDLFVVPMPQAGSSKIVFNSDRDGNTEIYSMNPDGSSLARLTNNSQNDDNPRWSPDGTKILFQSDRDNPETGNYEIYLMNADGSGQSRLTYDAGDDCNAAWSADGSKIVFQSLRNGVYYQVYVMNSDGTNQVNVTNGTSADSQPSWSPDGTKIAFASERDHAGRPSVYVMNANGSNQSRLTFASDPFQDEQPIWSRDGSNLAFVSTRDSVIDTWQETDDEGNILNKSRVRTNKEVYLMNLNGSNQLRLTNTLENDDSPSWSPDGTKIIFRSDRERECCDPTAQLWTMNADGSNPALLTENGYGDYSPSWASAGNQPPFANAGGPYSGMTSQAVQFNAGGSFDPDGTVISYSWDFGDNTSGSGVSPTHNYASVGTYTVTLTVSDNLGSQASASISAMITTNGIDQYAANFAQWALARAIASNESVYWNDIFRSAYQNGQGSLVLATREFGKTLFESSEYAARNRSDHEYVYDLYKAYLMRDPDQSGWDGWTSLVPAYGREAVRRGFDESVEFMNLVGTMTATGSITSGVSSLASARVDPMNQPGNVLLARDAEWSLPLLSLPGRAGLDLGLSLSYSSMVWTRSGPYLYFDEDRGTPSPGLRLGFPTIQEKSFDARVGKNVYVMIMSSGKRVELRQTGSSNLYEAGDASYLQLIDNGSLLVRSTDGTQFSYAWSNHEFRCTQIKDRHGNYLTINYNWLGDITTVTDTLARAISFNYDANQNLISITQTWTVNGVPVTHTWATFGWGTHSLNPGFPDALIVGAQNGSVIPVLTQVGLDDGSRFNFEYNSNAQMAFIRRYTSDNVQRSYKAYDYETSEDACPRLAATRVWGDNWSGINGVPAEVVTQYRELGDGSHEVQTPDATIYKEFYGGTGASPAWQRGLAIQSEVWVGDVRQKWTSLNWTQDNTSVNYQTNPRVTESNTYDASGNRRRVTIDYGTYAPYGLPWQVREYAADGATEIRHKLTEYNLSQPYLDRRIIGLVSEIKITDGTQPQTKITYGYDDPTKLQALPMSAAQHDQAYSTAFTTRGNVTSVSQWDVTDINNATKALTNVMSYNTVGHLVSRVDPLGHQESLNYADSFSDGNNSRNTFAYLTLATDADGSSSSMQYHFDFGARTRFQGPPPAGQSQGLIQTLTYDSAARVDRVTTTNNGAYVRYVYGPNYVQSFSTVNNIADDAYSIQVVDGLGRITASAINHPGSVGGYSGRSVIYDSMGRKIKESNPSEITSTWVPAGDDSAGWVFQQQTYDWQDRPLVTTNTDGKTQQADYGGCGCAGGEIVTVTDEGTLSGAVSKKRQRKAYSDVLGRTIKTEVLNWDGDGFFGTGGSVYSSVVNEYNARDQIVSIKEYAGAATTDGSCPAVTCQQTTMTYNGHGRLQAKHLPQQDAGTATTYNYNADGTISSVADARGATQTLTYDTRHLVVGISYSAPPGITVPDAVSFAYDDLGNRTSMTDGMGSASYNYNQLSQMTSETRSFTGLSGSFTLNYAFNLAGRLTSLTDSFGAQVGYNFDQAGRLSAVTGAGFANVSTYASNAQYRAWGMLKSLSYGNSKTLAVSYDDTLHVTNYEVPGVLKKSYQYYDDGSLKFTQDQLFANSKFDRSYEYDHVGRVTRALSGAEARGEAPTTDRPYNETLTYDAMNHLTMLDRTHWDRWDGSGPSTFVNDRVQGWAYDADGRALSTPTGQYVYDAAGNVLSFGDNDPYKTDQTFTGDGRQAKTIARRFDDVLDNWVTEKITYYLTSTVLGGALVTELSEQGAKERTLVHAAGEVLASQVVSEGAQSVEWEHSDASGASLKRTSLSGETIDGGELDVTGANAGLFKPLTYNVPDKRGLPVPYPGIADMLTNPGGGCTLERMPVPCELLNNLKEAGGVANETLFRGTNGEWSTYSDVLKSHGLGIFTTYAYRINRNNELQPVTIFNIGNVPFSSSQMKILEESYARITREDCQKFINDTLKKFKVAAEFDSLNKLLNRVKLSYFERGQDYSPAQLGVDTHSTLLIRGAFLAGASAVTAGDRVNIFLSDDVFSRTDLYFYSNIADTPSFIVHELFHVAGIDVKDVDSQQLTDEIQKHCKSRGRAERVVLRH